MHKSNMDISQLEKAFYYIEELDDESTSKENYIKFAQKFVKVVLAMNVDTQTIVAGILYPIARDNRDKLAQIQEKFGNTIHYLIDKVLSLSKFTRGFKKPSEKLRRMIIAIAKDVRVVLIKLIIRLLNMKAMKHSDIDRKLEYAEECFHIFIPLANRLGIGKIKWELEDLYLFYTNNEAYRMIEDMVNLKRDEREKYTKFMTDKISEELKSNNIQAKVTGRAKHFYSIYKKMYEKNKNFDDLYDLIAIRVLVEKTEACYDVLSIVHNQWIPISNRFKDYISFPKENGYKSIHTSITGIENRVIEIQIRTFEMHNLAEIGVAAHWKYKENILDNNSENFYSGLRHIIEWQKEDQESDEFYTITNKIFKNSIFVFTPAEEVIELPSGATPLDFAFSIHSNMGLKCSGAKVNYKMVPLSHCLSTGDYVEILTNNTRGPTRDWLKKVVTNKAKKKIRSFLKKSNISIV